MASVATPARHRAASPVGSVLKLWRGHRRMSQLDLSARSGVTPRHVSFVETGRAQPSRQLLDRLADALDMPLRDRNDLFLAAGFAPPYRALGLDDDELEVVAGAIDRILAGHEPFPAVVMDRHWNLLRTNHGADELFNAMLDLSAIDPPANVLELVFSNQHLRPHVANWSQLASALVARARREAVGGLPDARLGSMIERFDTQLRDEGVSPTPSSRGPVVDAAFIVHGTVQRYFSTITTLGTATDITLQEIRIELFHPDDT
jgi:transcriptional regulator with XRE-family HTH domain